MESFLKKWFKSALVIIIILTLWYLGSSLRLWSAYVLPGPQKVGLTFWTMVKSGSLWSHIADSFLRVATGFTIAFGLAFMLGIFAALKPASGAYYGSFVEFMRNVPPLSLIPLLILWFGIGETSKIIIIVLASFFPMFLNIKKGLLSCDVKLLEVGRSLGFTPAANFFKIMLPAALPDILVGMRIGLGYSWRAIIGAEMIAAASGLGYLILDAQQLSRSDKVIVGIIIIGTVGLVCDKLFSAVIKTLTRGGVDSSWS